MNHFFRLIFSLSFAAFMVASAGQSSNAAPAARQQSANFDGLWSVAIVTLQGPCDRSYRYPARIAGSRVMMVEFGRPMRGQVDRRPARLTTLLGNLCAGD